MGLLRIMMENLLDNAWKYTRKTEDADIEVRKAAHRALAALAARAVIVYGMLGAWRPGRCGSATPCWARPLSKHASGA